MDWNEVKAKPKKAKKKQPVDDEEGHYGGSTGNKLTAGPIRQYYESSGPSSKATVNKQASAIADYDMMGDENEEIKYETVTHDCAIAVQNARVKKNWT